LRRSRELFTLVAMIFAPGTAAGHRPRAVSSVGEAPFRKLRIARTATIASIDVGIQIPKLRYRMAYDARLTGDVLNVRVAHHGTSLRSHLFLADELVIQHDLIGHAKLKKSPTCESKKIPD
jgi:hypothetical protein